MYGVLRDILSKELTRPLLSFLLVNFHVAGFLAVDSKEGGIALLSSNISRLQKSKSILIYSSSSVDSKRIPILSNKFSSLLSQYGSAKIGKRYLNGQKKKESINHDLPKYVNLAVCFCVFTYYIM